MPRLFIAIELPDGIKEQLRRLRGDLPVARWAPPEQLHLTLLFLGEVESEKLDLVMTSLSGIHSPGFVLSLAEPGCFPNRKRPRVLWVGIKPEALLMKLAEQLRVSALACGIELEDRRFAPHITLGRIKQPDGNDADAFLNRAGRMEQTVIDVREFILFESRLGSRGAQHLPLKRFQLAVPQGDASGAALAAPHHRSQMETSR